MIDSIYESFIQSAKIAPKNSKMIIRHSIRGDIRSGETGLTTLLTQEGIIMAEHFGRKCTFDIDKIHTSTVQRCIQTSEMFARGYKNKNVEIIKTDILAGCYVLDSAKVQDLFSKESSYKIMNSFLKGEKLPGMRELNATMKILFGYIFQNKDSENMELFVTHDTFLTAIVCYCHEIELDKDYSIWSHMLEGAFLYLIDNEIHCIYRGVDKYRKFDFKAM